MQKVVTGPGAGDDLGSGAAAFSESVAVEHDAYTTLHVSGLTSDTDDPDIGGQTREVLGKIQANVAHHDGTMSDIVRVRVYVAEPHLTQANFDAIHDARRAFFDAGDYPASTLVEVSDLVRDGRLIEIEAEAVIPNDGWD